MRNLGESLRHDSHTWPHTAVTIKGPEQWGETHAQELFFPPVSPNCLDGTLREEMMD